MPTQNTILSDVQGATPHRRATIFRSEDIDESQYLLLLEGGFQQSYEEGRATLVGLLQADQSVSACRRILSDLLEHGDSELRSDMIRAFVETSRVNELLAGVTGLSVRNGALLFREYFHHGGRLTAVTEFMSLVSLRYRRAKRDGRIKPRRDFFSSIGDAISSLWDNLSKLVDQIVSAGKALADILSDLVEKSQEKINSVVERLVDAGKAAAWFLADLANEAYSTVESIVRALEKVLPIDAILSAAGNVLGSVVRALREGLNLGITTLLDAADASQSLLVSVSEALVGLASDAHERAETIIEYVTDEISQFASAVADALDDFIDAVYWTARQIAQAGDSILGVLNDAASNTLDFARSTLQGLLSGGVALTNLIGTLWDAFDVSGFFSDAVSLLIDIVDTVTDVYTAALDLGPSFLRDVMVGLVEAGEAVWDLVLWARGVGSTAVSALLDGLSSVADLTLSAIEQFGRAVVEVGQGVATLFSRAVDWGFTAIRAAFQGILNAGGVLVEALETFIQNVGGAIVDAVDALRSLGVTLADIMASALELGEAIFAEAVQRLIDLGHSLSYILSWAVDAAEDVAEILGLVFETVYDTFSDLHELVSWVVNRSFDILKTGLDVLVTVTGSLTDVLTTALTNPSAVFSTVVEAFREIGYAIAELFAAVVDASEGVILRLWNAFQTLGTGVEAILDEIVTLADEHFRRLLEVVVSVSVTALTVVTWAASRTVDVFALAMEAIVETLDSLVDLIEAVAGIGGTPLERMADWFATGVDAAVDFVTNWVIDPLIAAGKFALTFVLAGASVAFALVAVVAVALKADLDGVDYAEWPDDLDTFETDYEDRLVTLDPPTEDHAIVVMSDLHVGDADDVANGLDRFHKNANLTESVLNEYATDETDWTVVFNGDVEEFWRDDDYTFTDPDDKVETIVDKHESLYDLLSSEFYDGLADPRFIKLRGNHDNDFDDPDVVSALDGAGFPGIEVYDYARIDHNGQALLCLHGQQYDPWNCDANHHIGRFITNFPHEATMITDDLITDLFGDGATIQDGVLEVQGLEIPILVSDYFLPFYAPDEWEPKIEDEVFDPELQDEFPERVKVDESTVVETIVNLDVSVVMGHTHDPKILKDGNGNGRFLANTGTSGYWEGCVWTLEITTETVTLNGWVENDDGYERAYVVALDDPGDGTLDGENRIVANATF